MKKLLHIDLFSGIGGFALATEAVWENVEHIFVENDEFCAKVLKKHWPEAAYFGDIRTFTADAFGSGYVHGQSEIQPTEPELKTLGQSPADIRTPFILTGGFPCQPFSQAGRRKGTADDRFLWPEMFRVIREFHPRWVIAENVRGIINIQDGVVFEQVCADLESENYEVQPFIIPAVAVNAPHRRDRVWFVAHGESKRGKQWGQTSGDSTRIEKGILGRKDSYDSNTSSARLSGSRLESEQQKIRQKDRIKQSCGWNENWIEVATRLCRVDDEFSYWVDGRGKKRNSRNARLKALGNAIVPSVATEIMKAIKQV